MVENASNDPATQSVWQRAKADTSSIYRSAVFQVGVTIFELVAVPLTILFMPAEASTKTQVAVPILAGIVALAISFLSVLVVQLAVAPVRQRNTARDAVRRLERDATQITHDPALLEAQQERNVRERELRVAVAQMMEELEHGRAVLIEPNRWFFIDDRLADGNWKEHGHLLAEHGFAEAHKQARHAYRGIDTINRSITRGEDRAHTFINESQVQPTLEAIDAAIDALENVKT